MDRSLKVYWKLYFEKVSTADILQVINNPLRTYEKEFIDGAIIDIGCGQSKFLLDFAHTDRELIAIDNEQFQLDFLKKRAKGEDLTTIENWRFLKQEFPKDALPSRQYSVIILSDLLHFFTLDECVEIGKIILNLSTKGTMIYVGVHSIKHYKNNPEDENNNEYFKHYFAISDFEKIFSNEHFERVYLADIQKEDSKAELELVDEWLNRVLRVEGITDQKEIEENKKDYLDQKSQANIIAIFRKR
ncbi:MAG: class I SAM-dependent methyltransferase [Chitinophagaceae bacterium]